MSWAALLLAAALLVGAGPNRIRGSGTDATASFGPRVDPLAAASCFDVPVASAAASLPIASVYFWATK